MDIKETKVMEIIENLKTDYYKELKKKLEQRRIDLNNGETHVKNSPYTKEQLLKDVERALKKNKKRSYKAYQTISYVKSTARQLDQISEKYSLLNIFLDDISSVLNPRNKETDKLEPTDTYETYTKKYKKVIEKERRELSKQLNSIAKQLQKKLKKDAKDCIVNGDKLPISNYVSLKEKIEKGNYNLEQHIREDGYNSLENFVRMISYEKKSEVINVNIEMSLHHGGKILAAQKDYESKDHQYGRYAGNTYEKLKEIEKNSKEYVLNIDRKSLTKAKELYTKANNIAKEIKYLDVLIEIYGETCIKDTETFKMIGQLRQEQVSKINDLIKLADETYEKSGIQPKIDAEQRLRELQKNILQKKHKLNQLEEKEYNKNHEEIEQLKDEIFELEKEFRQIIGKNRDLNKPEYRVDLKLEETKEKEESKETIEKHSTKQKENVEYKPKEIELKDNLKDIRFSYYQQYNLKRISNPEKFSEMSFSEYLQMVAPQQKELIKYEKQKEEQNVTIYKLYINYVVSCGGKQNAMGFQEFAQRKYGLKNVDIPVEYEEVEGKKR